MHDGTFKWDLINDTKRAFTTVARAGENIGKVAATPFTLVFDGVNYAICEALDLNPRFLTKEMFEGSFFKHKRTYD